MKGCLPVENVVHFLPISILYLFFKCHVHFPNISFRCCLTLRNATLRYVTLLKMSFDRSDGMRHAESGSLKPAAATNLLFAIKIDAKSLVYVHF